MTFFPRQFTRIVTYPRIPGGPKQAEEFQYLSKR